jgi:hypothetical protein
MGKTVDTLLVTIDYDELVKQFGISWAKQVLGCGKCIRYITTFDDLVSTLQEYDQVGHLVIATHASSGSLELRIKNPKKGERSFAVKKLSEIIPMFNNKAPQVTTQLDIEGCVVATSPEELWDFAKFFQAPKATAYNYWKVLETLTLTIPRGSTVADVQAKLNDPYDDYLLQNTPLDEYVRSGKKEIQGVLVEWFRREFDDTKLEKVDSIQRRKSFKHRKDATDHLPVVTTRQQALDLGIEMATNPVYDFERITVQP